MNHMPGRRCLYALIVILIVEFGSTRAFGATIFGLYNTGVNNDGTLSATNVIDSHYSLISVPGGASGIAWVPSIIPTSHPFPGGWIVVPNAQWLAPATNATLDEPQGTYDYRLTFNLIDTSSNALDPTNATISGTWAADDDGAILFNGIPVSGGNTPGFSSLTPFTISSGFRAGTNTLDFIVTNGNAPAPNPTGILVVGLSGTANTAQNAACLSISMYPGIQISGTVGATYQLQYTTVLPATNWTTLTNILLPVSPFLYFDTQYSTNKANRFYRAVQVN
jgi:hypothetical protein